MEVTLSGPKGSKKTQFHSQTQQKSHGQTQLPITTRKKNTDPAATLHRKAAYACMRKLAPLLLPNVSENDVWEYIKNLYNVDSRSKFLTQEWATISAKFNSAYRHIKIREDLIQATSDYIHKTL